MKNKKTSWLEIIWKSLNEVMLIIGAIFIGFFFVNPSFSENYWIIYGVALVIITIISRIGEENRIK